MTLEEMRAKRVALVAEMGKLNKAASDENRDFNEAEQAQYDTNKAEVANLDKRIAREDELAGLVKDQNASAGSVARGATFGALKAEPAKREFESLGEFLHAATYNKNDQRLNFVEREGSEMQAAQRMDTGSAGGFAIPTQFRDTLMSNQAQPGIVRPRATVLPAGSPPDAAITIPALDQTNGTPDSAKMYGGVKVGWGGEGATISETEAKIREITLTPHEVTGRIIVTDKLLRNWQASSSLLEQQLRGAIVSAEDFAFISGNGVAKPLGFINAGAAKAINRVTTMTIKYADIVAMFERLRGTSGIWVVTKAGLGKLMTMEDTEGHLIWQANASAASPGTIFGLPVVVNERSPALGAKGDISLVDLSQYLIKDGSGPFVAASEHVYFESNKTVIKCYWNVDGQPWLTEPITEENGWTTSPFVVLDVPA